MISKSITDLEINPRFFYNKTENFNSRTFEAFLVGIINSFAQIILILENVMYHKVKRLNPFIEANEDRLQLVHLPSYSPQLNIIELVDLEIKKNISHNKYFPMKKSLMQAVFSKFRFYLKTSSV